MTTTIHESTADPRASDTTHSEIDDMKKLSVIDEGSSTTMRESTSTAEGIEEDGNNKRDSVQSIGNSHVGFSTVKVHSHRLTLGDNPGVSTGIPLTLGWDVEESETYDLETFEKQNSEKPLSRYTRVSREAIASQHHSRGSIVKVAEEVQEIKQSRTENEHDKRGWRNNKNRNTGSTTVSGEEKKKGFFGGLGKLLRGNGHLR